VVVVEYGTALATVLDLNRFRLYGPCVSRREGQAVPSSTAAPS
jgi:hypothetical protein